MLTTENDLPIFMHSPPASVASLFSDGKFVCMKETKRVIGGVELTWTPTRVELLHKMIVEFMQFGAMHSLPVAGELVTVPGEAIHVLMKTT